MTRRLNFASRPGLIDDEHPQPIEPRELIWPTWGFPSISSANFMPRCRGRTRRPPQTLSRCARESGTAQPAEYGLIMAVILLIEDDPSIRDSIESILVQAGYRVVTAANGAQGLRRFHAQRPDVVITDIVMPETDGLEVIMAIRKEWMTGPIIAISETMPITPGLDVLVIAKHLGATATIHKPVDAEELLRTVRDCLPPSMSGPPGAT